MKPVLGSCRCPVCKTPGQVMKASDKGRPYVMCDECDVQIFARSKRSGDAMLALIEGGKPPAPAPDEVKPQPAPTPAPKPEPKREQPPKPAAGGIFFGKK